MKAISHSSTIEAEKAEEALLLCFYIQIAPFHDSLLQFLIKCIFSLKTLFAIFSNEISVFIIISILTLNELRMFFIAFATIANNVI